MTTIDLKGQTTYFFYYDGNYYYDTIPTYYANTSTKISSFPITLTNSITITNANTPQSFIFSSNITILGNSFYFIVNDSSIYIYGNQSSVSLSSNYYTISITGLKNYPGLITSTNSSTITANNIIMNIDSTSTPAINGSFIFQESTTGNINQSIIVFNGIIDQAGGFYGSNCSGTASNCSIVPSISTITNNTYINVGNNPFTNTSTCILSGGSGGIFGSNAKSLAIANYCYVIVDQIICDVNGGSGGIMGENSSGTATYCYSIVNTITCTILQSDLSSSTPNILTLTFSGSQSGSNFYTTAYEAVANIGYMIPGGIQYQTPNTQFYVPNSTSYGNVSVSLYIKKSGAGGIFGGNSTGTAMYCYNIINIIDSTVNSNLQGIKDTDGSACPSEDLDISFYYNCCYGNSGIFGGYSSGTAKNCYCYINNIYINLQNSGIFGNSLGFMGNAYYCYVTYKDEIYYNDSNGSNLKNYFPTNDPSGADTNPFNVYLNTIDNIGASGSNNASDTSWNSTNANNTIGSSTGSNPWITTSTPWGLSGFYSWGASGATG